MFVTESWSGVGWKETLETIISLHSLSWTETSFANHAAKASSNLALNTARDEAPTTSLGKEVFSYEGNQLGPRWNQDRVLTGM